jgi:hypothetical protein
MKFLRAVLLLLLVGGRCVGDDVAPTNDGLRLFAFKPAAEERPFFEDQFKEGKLWAVYGVAPTDFIIFHLLDGSEFGHALPTLKIVRKGWNFGLAVIDERALFSSRFLNPRIEKGDILAFEVPREKAVRTVRISLILHRESGMIFADRRGVEVK